MLLDDNLHHQLSAAAFDMMLSQINRGEPIFSQTKELYFCAVQPERSKNQIPDVGCLITVPLTADS